MSMSASACVKAFSVGVLQAGSFCLPNALEDESGAACSAEDDGPAIASPAYKVLYVLLVLP